MVAKVCKIIEISNKLVADPAYCLFFMCSYFPYKISGKNTYVIYEKHVRLFGKTCTCFPENMMMFLYH